MQDNTTQFVRLTFNNHSTIFQGQFLAKINALG